MKTLGLLLLLLVSINTRAAVHIVVNTNDSGAGSLRYAVFIANSNDTVTFDAALLSGGNNVVLLNSEIEYSKSLTIIGLMTQSDTLFVSGNFSSRVFKILSGTSTLYKMAIINGFTTGYGGGIYADCDSLKVINSVVKGNTSSGINYAIGGGIFTSSRLDIINSIITENSTYSNRVSGSSLGGGVYSDADTLLIENSTISYNTVVSDSSTSRGGGVYSSSSLRVINSTFNDNSVLSNEGTNSSDGGGIYVTSSANSLTLLNTTITENTASSYYASYGGGVVSSATTSYILNSTISGNVVSGDSYSNGGGVYLLNTSLTLGSNIIALNNGGANVYGTLTNNFGYNVFSDAPTIYTSTDQINVNSIGLKLGVLQNNGGNTKTLMPGVGSIAIDMGTPLDITDAQNGPIVGRRDVGAAEYIVSCVSNSSSFNDSICQGNAYMFNGQNLTSGGAYYDTLINAGGCDSIVTLNLTVKSPVTPSISISANGPTEVCQGESISFTSSIINGGDSPSYQWKRNGNNVGSGISTYSPSINSNVNGDVITCILTSNAFCLSNQKDTSNVITLTINPLPIVVINQNGTDLEATAGYANYEWSYNGNVINNANSNIYTPTQNGQYSVEVTDANGCENTDDFSFNTVKVNSLSMENAISVYPNPTLGDVYIKSPITIKEVSVYDYSGAQKLSYNSTQKISLSELSKGTYIIKLIDEANNQYFKKVVLVN